jgi:lysozyme family protein
MGIILPVNRNTIRSLTETQAAGLFRWQMWNTLNLDLIPLRPAVVIYDAAVNSGPRQSVKFAQRGYNACVAYGQPLDADGIMGPATRAAMQQADTDKILMAMLDQREQFYHKLVADDPSQEVFLDGWINRVTDLRRYVRGL